MTQHGKLIDTLREQAKRAIVNSLDAREAMTRAAETLTSAHAIGTVAVPLQLTAEDGYKYALSAEFFEEIDITNPDYDEDDEDSDEVLHIRVPIQWTTIKEIHRAIVKHALTLAASQNEGK